MLSISYIIYLGASSNTWQNHTQLLAQVNDAISIFKKIYPNYISLFVFNQLFAHILLGPDVLHVFDINKSNGGKQQKQNDTIIPMNNPYPKFHRKPQKITRDTSKAKGIQQILEKCGFNVHEICVKCFLVCLFKNSVIWPTFSASRMIFTCKYYFLNKKSHQRGIFASFCPSFTMNSI